MISVKKKGDIHIFRLARSLFGRGLYFTAAYWVDGLMIDTGCAHTVGELIPALNGYTIEQVVNTHSHEDHIGGNAAVSQRFGARIKAHPKALPVMASPREKQPLHPYQLIMWGYPRASFGTAVGDTVETSHHRFRVIHTPGHSVDHICLYEPDEGWLFTGDTYIGGRDTSLRADYDIWGILGSLKTLASLDVSLLCTGSGSIREQDSGALLEKIRYLEDLADRIHSLHDRGLGYGSMRRELFGREGLVAYVTLGHFSGKHLVRSFVEDRPGA